MQMFESGLGAVPEADTRGVQVFDLAELLEMSVVMSQPMPAATADAPTPDTAPSSGTPAAIEEQAAVPEPPAVSDEDVAAGETPTV